MNKRISAAVCLAAAVAVTTWGGEKRSHASEGGASAGPAPSVSAGTGISVKTVNGQTTVSYKGKEVFSGATSGSVSGRSSSVNGTEYAAAFDGDKVLWENVSGAAQQLKACGAAPLAPDPAKLQKLGKKKRRVES
jgi:hypothetical protein